MEILGPRPRWAVALVVALALPPAVSSQVANEYDVKAAFLFNFTRFVDWPPSPRSAPFCIGVDGAGPFNGALENGRNEMCPGVTPERRAALATLFSDSDKLAKSVDELSQLIQTETALRRIYCLTPHNDSILMWSHYSNNHTVICLEFTTGNTLFQGAMKVEYLERYPTFLP